jgi:hypothetical protein
MNCYVTLLCFPEKKLLIRCGYVVEDWDNTAHDVQCKKGCKYALKYPARKLSSIAYIMQEMDNGKIESNTHI